MPFSYVLASGKLGKGGRASNSETFHWNPAGINPAWQSRASSQKRVLRGAGRLALRSVDSEAQRRVIEPRKLENRPEPSSWTYAGAASVALHLVPQNAAGLTGVEEHGERLLGFPRNLRDPDVSTAE